MIFAIAFDKHYSKMARVVINALNYYHNSPLIIVFTTDINSSEIIEIKEEYQNIEIIPFKDEGYFYGSWHPLIWAKVEAFNLDINETIIFLDVDMIIYNNLSKFCQEFENSGKIIGASRDFAPLVKQFNSGFDFRQFFFCHFFNTNDYLNAPAFNAGALIFKPDKKIYKELKKLSKEFHDVTFYPEQAILNYFCFLNDGWFELNNFSIMPFSREILQRKENTGMLHFYTPRPDFMMKPIIREGEPTLENMIFWFEQSYNEKYPITEIKEEYINRLTNNIK